MNNYGRFQSNHDSGNHDQPADLRRNKKERRLGLPRLPGPEKRNPSRPAEPGRSGESGDATRRPHPAPGVRGDSGSGVELEDAAERPGEGAPFARSPGRGFWSWPAGTAAPG